jgi:hypothetical protein
MTQPAGAPVSPPGPGGAQAPSGGPPVAGVGGQGPGASTGGAGASGGAAGDARQEAIEDHALGSGDVAAEATSRPGQGSLRNEYLHEAERLTVEGDAVGRDKNIFLVGGKQLARLRLLSHGLVTRTPSELEAPGPISWPVLHLTTRLPEVRSAIVTLWRCVLNEALFHDEAEQVMTRWTAAAEGDLAMREAFLRLARAIARNDERSLMILDRYCALWVSADNLRPLPMVSSALQTVLTTDREA